MKDIQKIHEEIFNYLQKWSEQNRASKGLNPYFYMRNQKDKRFEKGYWFIGAEDYLCVSFWSGGDSLNKTPNVYFNLDQKHGVRVVIVSREDSDVKREYFNEMVGQLNVVEPSVYIVDKDKNGKSKRVWHKVYSNDYKDYMKYLPQFIETDKNIIDRYVNDTSVEFEDFVSEFSFIATSDFDKMLSKVLNQQQIIKKKERKSGNSLPFSIEYIKIENFQGIRYAFIEDLPNDAGWIYITGENGYGKTTLLQAIALGFDTQKELEKYMETDTRITIAIRDKEIIIRSKDSSIALKRYPNVLGYGTSRLNVQPRDTENKGSNGDNVLGLFDAEARMKNINYELFAANKTDESTFKDLENIIRIVTKERIKKIEIRDREAFFSEQLSNGELLKPLPLDKLAAGFRNLINLVSDIYLRFKAIYPDKSHTEFEGIVMIDEIETHLHPILQKELSEALINKNAFPKIQFIATTHSPMVFLGMPPNTVLFNISKDIQDETCIQRINIDLPNVLPNQILTSSLFGMENIRNIHNQGVEHLNVETEPEIRERKLTEHKVKELSKNFIFKLPTNDKN
jgi:AAA15 family ATPase/GTPase